MRRRAGNWQERAKSFQVGQAVALVGDRLSSEGRVLAVWPAIGMCDVQYPTGSVRLPVEDLQIIRPSEDEYVTPIHSDIPGGSGTVPVPSESLRQLMARSRRAGLPRPKFPLSRIKMEQLLRLLAASYKPEHLGPNWSWTGTFPKHAVTHLMPVLRETYQITTQTPRDLEALARRIGAEYELAATKTGSLRRITALYWNQRDRQYRCTRSEFEGSSFACPKCGTLMKSTIYKREEGKSVRLLGCPGCLFLIRRQDILDDHCQICEE